MFTNDKFSTPAQFFYKVGIWGTSRPRPVSGTGQALYCTILRQLLPPAGELFGDFFGAGGAGEVALGHGGFEIEDGQGIRAEGFIHGLEFGEGELVEGFAGFFGEGDDGADGVVGLAERQAAQDEVVREVGGEQGGVARGGGASGAVYGDVLQHGGDNADGGAHGVGGVEELFFVFLEVAVVGHGQAFQEGEEGHEIAVDAGGFATGEFGDVGVLLLGHEGGTGGVGIGDLDEIKFTAGPEDEVLGEAGNMHGENGGGGGEFEGEIAVADGVHGVLGELRAAFGIDEAKQFGDQFAVEGQGGPGDGAAAEGADIHAGMAIPEAFAVALEHLDVGEEMVGEVDGLGALEMGVAGDDDIGIVLAEGDEGALEIIDFTEQAGDLVAEPEADIEGDLVVAGAGGVEFGTGGYTLGELGLDVHVDVFEFVLPTELAGGDLFTDGVEAVDDGLELGFGEDADGLQHGGVGHGAEEVVLPEAPVEGNGFGELGDVGGGAAAEAAAAGNGRFFAGIAHRANVRWNGQKVTSKVRADEAWGGISNLKFEISNWGGG